MVSMWLLRARPQASPASSGSRRFSDAARIFSASQMPSQPRVTAIEYWGGA